MHMLNHLLGTLQAFESGPGIQKEALRVYNGINPSTSTQVKLLQVVIDVPRGGSLTIKSSKSFEVRDTLHRLFLL